MIEILGPIGGAAGAMVDKENRWRGAIIGLVVGKTLSVIISGNAQSIAEPPGYTDDKSIPWAPANYA
ncbi:MAG: hypothetical protein WC359_13645 [Dehalococcoidia bacterium]|jgi:hypothetical protein